MKRKKASKKLNITIVLLAALLVIILSIGGLGAKYKGSEETEGTNVTFSADLVEKLTLTETKAVPTADGTYTLDSDGDQVVTNSYKVLPGVDIPKDPKITITGKTDLGAYLYVELVDSGSNVTISYDMSSDWKDIGIPNRMVYVYTGGDTDALKIDASTFPGGEAEIYLLKDNIVFVSETYAGVTFGITFNAYMVQAIEGKSAVEVFKEAVL